MHRVRLDAERENDGTFLNQLWKLSMINLWNGNHYKYLILGHRITAGKHIEISLKNENSFTVYEHKTNVEKNLPVVQPHAMQCACSG